MPFARPQGEANLLMKAGAGAIALSSMWIGTMPRLLPNGWVAVCPPRRNGNMPVGQGLVRRIIQVTVFLQLRPTMTAVYHTPIA